MRMSESEYLAALARIEAHKRKMVGDTPQDPAVGVDDESELHQAILESCRHRGWICFHGSMAHKTRRTIGEPDFTILADCGRAILVECKKRNEKPSPAQQGMILWASRLGHTIHVVRSIQEFESVVNQQS